MLSSTNLKLLLLLLAAAFLGLVGYFPAGLPFIPDAPYSDAATAHWSAAEFTRDTVLSGDYPLWRDTILIGAPFAANPLNKTAYPLQWLVLLLPAAIHLNMLILLHLFVAAAGMWAWARALDIEPMGAAFAAFAYAFAPRIVAHLGAGHLDIVYAMAWLPWLLWTLHPPNDDNRALYVLRLALIAALLALADVRVSLFGFMLGAVYLLWRGRTPGRIGLAALAVMPFALLVAALVVPLISWQPYLSRAALTVEEAGTFSIEPLALAGLILPPHEGGAGFETMVYLGLPVLVLALIGLFTRRRTETMFWGGVVTVAALWALGLNTPFWRTLAQFEPLRWFRVPGRAWLIVVLVAALLAGYGVQVLMRAAVRWREQDPPGYVFWLRLGAAGAGGLLAVCGLTLLNTAIIEMPPSSGALMIFSGLAVGAVLLAVLLRRGQPQIVALSLLAITFADYTVTGVQWAAWRGVDEWAQPHAELAGDLRTAQAERVYSPSYALPQEVAELYGLRLFYGVDPFQLQAAVEAIEAASNVPVTGYSITVPPLTGIETDEDIPLANQGIAPDADALAVWNVSHVIAAYDIDAAGLQLAETINGVNVYENTRYTPSTEAPALLPPDEVARLHRVTLASVWVSAVSFVLVGAGLAWTSIRRSGGTSQGRD